MATHTHKIEWADGRVDLANSNYAARALVLARFPGAHFSPDDNAEAAAIHCFPAQTDGAQGHGNAPRPIAVIQRLR